MVWTWSRFSYLCRRVQNSLHADEPVRDCIKRYSNEQAISIYTENQPSSKLARELEADLASIANSGVAKSTAGIYSKINFMKTLSADLQYKRANFYLLYITLIFAVVSAIYSVYVMPAMSRVFEMLDIATPPSYEYIMRYGWLMSLGLVLILLISLLLGYRLKRAFRLDPDFSESVLVKLFAFPAIKRAHARIIESLRFPVKYALGQLPEQPSIINNHLMDIERSNMCMATEIEEILSRESAIMATRCEKQLRYITIVISVLIVFMLWQFLMMAYLPIFHSGEAI